MIVPVEALRNALINAFGQITNNLVEGSVFIELALALPLLMMVMWGVSGLSSGGHASTLTDAATVGIEAWSAGDAEQQVVQAVDLACRKVT